MYRINTPADVANTGRVQIDAGDGVSIEVPLRPSISGVPGLQDVLDAKIDVAGKVIATENLNTLTATGTYYQLSNAQATTARNYPVTTAGRVGVTTSDTGWAFQEYTTYSQGWPKTWRRNLNGSTWGAWRLLIDELELAARLAEVAPRDTGDRNITPLIPGVMGGHWTVRRVGNWVYMNLYDLDLPVTAGDYWQQTGFLPVGLRPPAASQYVHFPGSIRTVTGFTPGPFRVDRYGGVTVYGVQGKLIAVTAAWFTNDAFPTNPIGDPA